MLIKRYGDDYDLQLLRVCTYVYIDPNMVMTSVMMMPLLMILSTLMLMMNKIFLDTFVDNNYCVQVWHDIACYHKKPFVCEDSDTLMEFAKQTSPALAPRI
jgi:hypothetical protein